MLSWGRERVHWERMVKEYNHPEIKRFSDDFKGTEVY